MNMAPIHPVGVYLGMTITSILVLAAIFEGGKLLARGSGKLLAKESPDEQIARTKRANGTAV